MSSTYLSASAEGVEKGQDPFPKEIYIVCECYDFKRTLMGL